MCKFIFLVCFLSQTLVARATSFQTNAFSPLGGRYDNGYPEARYQQVLDLIEELYSPVFENFGGTFHIMRDWSDGAVNMWAFKLGDEHWLEVPGGMSRYHLISEEGFLMSVCHELGHLLGGAPFKGGGDISLEGQSDYFAGRDCIEMVLKSLSSYELDARSDDVLDHCALRFDQKLCERILSGAESLTSYYAELEKSKSPKLSTPSDHVVDETLNTHPPAQCRLDTFFAGYKKNKRPTCWYKN